MTRILADLPEDDVKWLDALAKDQGKSRAAVLREAVASYRLNAPGDWIDRGFGLWKERPGTIKPVDWQRRMRAENTKPWDADYDDTRAEFPDLFTEDDDRERARYLALIARSGTDGAADGP